VRFGSLPFYLSKPLGRGHYLLGKGLALAVFINMMTTLPALVLYVEFALLSERPYFWDKLYLVGGILGYGAVLTVCLSLLLLATALWLRRTVPLVMVWTTLFVFCRELGTALVAQDRLGLNRNWLLIDLWNNMKLIGVALLPEARPPGPNFPQPDWWMAALVLGGVCLSCLSYLVLRIRAVEIVR
jgi:hypothetical protein